jgi:peptidoglycan/xylan/chitin deacetylase (PgdA/CDA1 family)
MSSIFVLNYHTIVPKRGFDVACGTLDVQLRLLKIFCDVVPLDAICDLLTRQVQPRRTTVAVTFDDGYLDTFVYALPLCKKHRIRPTVFPITSRIIDDDRLRPTLEDHWQGRVAYRELYASRPMDECNREFLESGSSASFMSRAELRRTAEFMDIGSHGSVHARVFCEDAVVDLYDGHNGDCSNVYAYEERPVRGFPLFPTRNNLAARRGFLRSDVKDFVRSLDNGYFLGQDWKGALRADLTRRFPTLLTFETEEHRRQRIDAELLESKSRLQAICGLTPRYFAYPYGHHDPLLEEVVAGQFDAAFTTEVDVIRMNSPRSRLPRAKVHRDIYSFVGRMVKFGRRRDRVV